jgi:hypothetical protein
MFIFVAAIWIYLRTIQILIISKIQSFLGLIITTDINWRRIKIKMSLSAKTMTLP